SISAPPPASYGWATRAARSGAASSSHSHPSTTSRSRWSSRGLDRVFWMWLSQWWARWREALHVVQPQTVIRCHRQGFRAFWNWKSRRGRIGRPPVDLEIAKLVRTMALANPLWGAPRIHGELLKLGLDVSQRTVGRPRRAKPPSQTW